MKPVLPHWAAQRQVKPEPVNETTLRLKAPQLPTYEIAIQQASSNAGWNAELYGPIEGEGSRPQRAASPAPLPDPTSAWEAAFELYRANVIV